MRRGEERCHVCARTPVVEWIAGVALCASCVGRIRDIQAREAERRARLRDRTADPTPENGSPCASRRAHGPIGRLAGTHHRRLDSRPCVACGADHSHRSTTGRLLRHCPACEPAEVRAKREEMRRKRAAPGPVRQGSTVAEAAEAA